MARYFIPLDLHGLPTAIVSAFRVKVILPLTSFVSVDDSPTSSVARLRHSSLLQSSCLDRSHAVFLELFPSSSLLVLSLELEAEVDFVFCSKSIQTLTYHDDQVSLPCPPLSLLISSLFASEALIKV
jgi:hypothetical protein